MTLPRLLYAPLFAATALLAASCYTTPAPVTVPTASAEEKVSGPEDVRQVAADVSIESLWPGYGAIIGKVSDPTGGPVDGVQIRLLGTAYSAGTGTDGRFEIPDVVPGLYPVIVAYSGVAFDTLAAIRVAEGARVRIQVEVGDVVAQARAARGAEEERRLGPVSIEVTLTDSLDAPVPNARVTVVREGLRATTDSRGIASIRGLPDGVYSLSVRQAGYATATVDSVRVVAGEIARTSVTLGRAPAMEYWMVESTPEVVRGGGVIRPTEEPSAADLPEAGLEELLTIEDTELYEQATVSSPPGATRIRTEQASQVKAGSHDDNEEYPAFLRFLGENRRKVSGPILAPFSDRIIVRIEDAAGAPAMGVPYEVRTRQGSLVWAGQTLASGESVVYPRVFSGTDLHADELRADNLVVSSPRVDGAVQPGTDGIVTLHMSARRGVANSIPVDVAFVIDATGSMGDEIQRLRDVLFSIHTRLHNATAVGDIRFGMVVYRDRGDRRHLEVVPFTASVDSFEVALSRVAAEGGGDYPEDVNEGLRATLENLQWRDGAVAAAFLIADAPPHMDYGQDKHYLWAAQEANRRAIRIHSIGASGLTLPGEYMFRQLSAASNGEFIFLTYGERGESSGRSTPDDPGRVSHHTGANWSDRRLDDIVVDLIRRDLAYQTDVQLLATDTPRPSEQDEHLTLRMNSLWDQITRQLAARGQDATTALLLPFEAVGVDTTVAGYLRDISTETLLRYGRLQLIERDRLAAILAEHELSVGGLVSPDEAVELGNLLNSRIVLTGTLWRVGVDRIVHVRAVDVETSRIIAAARVRI